MGYSNEFANNEFQSKSDQRSKNLSADLGAFHFTYVPLRSGEAVHVDHIEALSDGDLLRLFVLIDLFFGMDLDSASLRAAVEGEMIERGLL